MSDEVRKRRQLAEQIAPAYAANPNVAAVLLAGSVARGTADGYSDIEIDVYWRTPPSREELLSAIAQAGGQVLHQHVDEYEWADSFYIAGIKVDTSQFLLSTLDGWIADVIERADMEVEKQIRITALQHGHALYGAEQIERWRAQAAPYPDALQEAMLAEHLWFQPHLELRMLAERDQALLFQRNVMNAAQQIMDVLTALNRQYLPHPYHKWLDWELARLPFAPPDLAQRLRTLLRAEPLAAVELLRALVNELFALVEQHAPAYDTRAARAEFELRRVQEAAPQ